MPRQVALCLGIGGLGCSVALGLCRLGVKKVILVDHDCVEAHNLNRQILFSQEDIGKSKVECAARALQTHNLRSEIVTLYLDATKEWNRVVEAAKEATVIFNMIDVGDYFDTAVNALALKLDIPMIIGGTFQTTLTVDYVAPGGKPCWNCVSDVPDKELLQRLTPERITTYNSIEFIPFDAKPVGASNVFVASTCANMMISAFAQALHGIPVPTRMIFYYMTYDIDKWHMAATPNCIMCGKT